MRAGRVRYFELAIAASVVLISVASLVFAVYIGQRQTDVMERALAADHWPSMQYSSGNFDEEREAWRISLVFSNQGVGPARVRYFVMRYRGELLRGGVGGFLARCCGPEELSEQERIRFVGGLFAQQRLRSVTDVVAPRVFAPGERIEFAVLDRPPEDDAEARALWLSVDRARRDIAMEICYCSVFDDCWTAVFGLDEETGLFSEDRREVEVCEAPTE
jgi:hypothetical protein